jgi:nickel-dependent lactate racemase
MTVLRYGADSSLNLQLAAEGPLGLCGVPKGTPLTNTAAAMKAALEQPLDYPSLGQCTTPGDRVAIAVGAEVPQVAKVTAAIVQALLASGVDADGLTILQSTGETGSSAEDPCSLLATTVAERIRVRTHDPADRRNLAYLAASETGEPILLNRMLTDADVVLPVGVMQPDRATGYYGIHTALYPEFSDFKTQARFRKHDRFSDNGHHRELRHEVNHVAWLLGVNFTVQIVPAAGDEVLHVLAGQSDAVRHRGHELYRDAWTWPVTERAELVIAAIEGGPSHQTWENLGRVLESAGRLVDDGGAIAVCCELAATPGPAVQRLMGAPGRDAALRHIRRDNPRDLLPALQLARALESHRVYLLSRLDAELVEGLEMIPVESPDDICRLAQRSRSCLVVANAVRAIVRVERE